MSEHIKYRCTACGHLFEPTGRRWDYQECECGKDMVAVDFGDSYTRIVGAGWKLDRITPDGQSLGPFVTGGDTDED